MAVCSWGACSTSEFSSNGAPKRSDKEAASPGDDTSATANDVAQDGSITTETSTDQLDSNGGEGTNDDLIIDENKISSPECLTRVLPLRVVLALDVSSSMAPHIEVVKSTLVDFGDKLKQITPLDASEPIKDLKVGMITFIDGVKQTFPLTADLDSLSQTISSIASDNDPTNTDMPEGGLVAVEQAIAALTTDVAAQEAITVVVVVTDDLAHDGSKGPGERIFTSPSLEERLKAKSLDYLRIFDASPTSLLSWSPSGSWIAAAQWENLRTVWRSARNNTTAGAGASLGFPPSHQTLLEDVPRELQKSLKICK